MIIIIILLILIRMKLQDLIENFLEEKVKDYIIKYDLKNAEILYTDNMKISLQQKFLQQNNTFPYREVTDKFLKDGNINFDIVEKYSQMIKWCISKELLLDSNNNPVNMLQVIINLLQITERIPWYLIHKMIQLCQGKDFANWRKEQSLFTVNIITTRYMTEFKSHVLHYDYNELEKFYSIEFKKQIQIYYQKDVDLMLSDFTSQYERFKKDSVKLKEIDDMVDDLYAKEWRDLKLRIIDKKSIEAFEITDKFIKTIEWMISEELFIDKSGELLTKKDILNMLFKNSEDFNMLLSEN